MKDSRQLGFALCNGNLILKEGEASGSFIPLYDEVKDLRVPGSHVFSFAMHGGGTAYGLEVADDATLPEGMKAYPLRQTFFILSNEEYLMAGKMRELIFWNKETVYCGRCGAEMSFDTEISKKCDKCGHVVWPALQIAIIVLIKRGDEVLLVQSRSIRKDYLGLVAGFVETGETLEQAVVREVKEETGLRIKNLRYFASQSWPYPCNLMAGFVADYESGSLHIQESELRKGGWYTRDNLPPVPDEASIARRLIDNWVAGKI